MPVRARQATLLRALLGVSALLAIGQAPPPSFTQAAPVRPTLPGYTEAATAANFRRVVLVCVDVDAEGNPGRLRILNPAAAGLDSVEGHSPGSARSARSQINGSRNSARLRLCQA